MGLAILGIALFFTLISFVPQFRIEGPETFHRFGEAAMTGQAICLAVALAFVGWMNQPLTFVGSFVLFSGLLVATGVRRFTAAAPTDHP